VTRQNTNAYQAFPVILERFRVDQFLWGDAIPSSKTAVEVQKELQLRKVELGIFEAGEIVDCGDGVRLEKLAVAENGFSLLLTYGEFRFFW
jgi:hypothetical protein